MEEKAFSKILQKLRKEAGMTQEQLAGKLGVSPQAVSKWENGSYPEGDLLPRLADQFDVSIDYLYGRGNDKTSLEQYVVDELSKIWEEPLTTDEKVKKLAEKVRNILWACNISGWETNRNYYDAPIVKDSSNRYASAIFNNYEYRYMSLNEGKEFYINLKEPESEEGYNVLFKDSKDTRELFKRLSDKDYVDIICYLYSLARMEFATTESISKATGISLEKTEKVLEFLVTGVTKNGGNKAFESIALVGCDGEGKRAYSSNENYAGLFLVLFEIADYFTYGVAGYSLQIDNRNKPWLKKQEKKGK